MQGDPEDIAEATRMGEAIVAARSPRFILTDTITRSSFDTRPDQGGRSANGPAPKDNPWKGLSTRQPKRPFFDPLILGVSELTVKKHLESVFHTLGVENRTMAVVIALEGQRGEGAHPSS
jgi:hypothetical protein